MLTEAQRLDGFGFNVLPANPGQKAPKIDWLKWKHKRTSHMLKTWFGRADANYWIACGGISQVYVLDIDSPEAERWWREAVQFGAEMDATACVKTSKGHHYYFWVPADDMAKGWSFHEGDLSFDVRGTGTGVIAPPSVHESGHVYTWLRSPNPEAEYLGLVPAPDWLKSREGVQGRIRTFQGLGDTTEGRREAIVDLGTSRSMLSTLLSKPANTGGRNDWLARVAGHYAKTYRKQPDLYQVHCRQANAMLADPLDDDEFLKTINSIWSTEVTQHPERGIEQTGYLLSGGTTLLTQTRVGKADAHEYQMAEWADFDLRVEGVIGSGEGDIIYDCVMARHRDGATFQVMVPGKTFGQGHRLSTFLGGYGVSISRPDNTWPAQPPDPVRLLRYLESQDAPRSRVAPCLGWDGTSEAFLTFDGIITADGAHEFNGVRPDPMIKVGQRANYYYGFQEGTDRAREILREVCTFHDEATVSIFGGWWAACLLKPQLSTHTSLFPIMVIEAASGSGKTNGFFPLMMQLNGSLQGPSTATAASTRDRIASHANGIVWLDDMDTLGRIEELLRVTASGETVTKKNIDNTGNVNVALRAPVVVSGEQLGLGTQKALMDRIVLLNPPKPDGRQSLHHPGKPQWDDIVALAATYPLTETGDNGLTVFAGTLQLLALQQTDAAVARLRSARHAITKTGITGRQADKIAIVVAGAWLLDRLTDPDLEPDARGAHEARVWEWSASSAARSFSAGEWDNRLTQEVLPWALRFTAWPQTPIGAPPVWVEDSADDVVWVNCSALADAWRDNMRGRIIERTDTRRALLDQLQRCQEREDKRYFDTSRGRTQRNQASYWALRGEIARTVLERSRN